MYRLLGLWRGKQHGLFMLFTASSLITDSSVGTTFIARNHVRDAGGWSGKAVSDGSRRSPSAAYRDNLPWLSMGKLICGLRC